MSDENVTREPPETITVKLLSEHTHNGITFPHGTVIEVNEADAEFICDTAKIGTRL